MKHLLLIFFLTYCFDSLAFNTIKVKGNTKTLESVIVNQSKLELKKDITKIDIKIAKRRLLNTGLFNKVEITQKSNSIIIEVQERWTTIPILKFSSGGGVGQLVLGVFDPNVAGRYIEAGGQYTRLDETNAGVLWLKVPRLNNSNWGLDFQLWKTNRLRTKFDQNSDDPVVKTGFLQTREKLYTSLNYEFSENLMGKFSYEYNNDSFTDKLVPEEAKISIQRDGLPPETKFHIIGTEFEYGNLIDSGTRQEGMTTSFLAQAAISDNAMAENFFVGELELRFYKTISDDSTFAFRFNSGVTNTNVLQYWYYLGGLNKIRGFADNRFAGKYFWLANTEFRHLVLTRKSFFLQAVSFVDLTTTAEKINTVSSLQAASVGAGLRVILPKLYRFVLRLDFAKPIKKEDDNILSFGVQQFF